MRQTRAIELGTGLFVLLGFAALFFLVTQITSREFGLGSGGYRLTATFEQVGGLKPGAPVSMSGVTSAASSRSPTTSTSTARWSCCASIRSTTRFRMTATRAS